MPITERKTTLYACSDGQSFEDKLDAELHEGVLTIRAVADKHGYSTESFSRENLAELLIEHAEEIADALDAYIRPLAAKRMASAEGGRGALTAAFLAPNVEGPAR